MLEQKTAHLPLFVLSTHKSWNIGDATKTANMTDILFKQPKIGGLGSAGTFIFPQTKYFVVINGKTSVNSLNGMTIVAGSHIGKDNAVIS